MTRANRGIPPDQELDRLLEAELRAAAQPAPVDLRAKVLAAIDSRPAEPRGVRTLPPRCAFTLAGAAAIFLALVVTWRAAVAPAPRPHLALVAPPIPSTAIVTGRSIVPTASTPSRFEERRRRPAVASSAAPKWEAEADIAAAEPARSAEPYLPGAPAGDLGDPLAPLPSPPPITFTPIQSAPRVSETARPVTDFPADASTPAASTGPGRSGGTSR